jgi:hypothetical protein
MATSSAHRPALGLVATALEVRQGALAVKPVGIDPRGLNVERPF